MADQENDILKLETEFPAVSGSAFAAARDRALASGHNYQFTSTSRRPLHCRNGTGFCLTPGPSGPPAPAYGPKKTLPL